MNEAIATREPPILKEIELSKCDIHPLFKNMRFDCGEDIEKLSELIRINGQELPGVVVPVPGKEGYYWSTIGFRRLLACKMSMKKYGTPLTFLAIIKDGLTDQDIAISKYVENFSEDGSGRKDLCFLEEAASLTEMLARFPTEFRNKLARGVNTTEEVIQRKVELFKRLDPGTVADLHKLERYVFPKFYFTYEHVESLVSLDIPREAMLKVAALVAERRAPPSFVDSYALALDSGTISEPEWLYSVFPAIERRKQEKTNDNNLEIKAATSLSSNSTFLTNAVSARCYSCGFDNPFKTSLKGSVTFLNLSDPIHKEMIEPISYLLPARACWNCHKLFSIVVHGKTKVKSIPPVGEDDLIGEGLETQESKLGLFDFDQDAEECKEGCVLCHWIFATKEGRFRLDHGTGQFVLSVRKDLR